MAVVLTPSEPPFPLNKREMRVAVGAATGKTNAEIAADLGRSTNTVKNLMTNIYAKTGAGNRVELALVAIREGWIVVEVRAR